VGNRAMKDLRDRWCGSRSLRAGLAVSLAFCAAAVAGCSTPNIHAFAASPRRMCPSTKEVVLTWAVDGSATLSSSPGVPGLGAVPAIGRRSIPPMKGTITLTASKFFRGSVQAQQVLSFVEDGETTSMAPDTQDVTCDGAHRQVIAALAFEGQEYDGAVAVKRLSNPGSREILVAHRGRSWTVAPGAGVEVVPRPHDNLPDPAVGATGTWILRAPLLEGERCGDPSALPALRIMLNADLGC
jgi:hypothetical protein